MLTESEIAAFNRIRNRIDQICKKAFETQVPVLIDAEDSWIQNPIDELAYEMMRKYNGQKAIVFNTYQKI